MKEEGTVGKRRQEHERENYIGRKEDISVGGGGAT
jgi:hypothetical protein